MATRSLPPTSKTISSKNEMLQLAGGSFKPSLTFKEAQELQDQELEKNFYARSLEASEEYQFLEEGIQVSMCIKYFTQDETSNKTRSNVFAVDIISDELTASDNNFRGTLYDPAMGIHDRNRQNISCTTCNNTSCAGHPGRIKLPEPIFNPDTISTTINVMMSLCQDCSKLILDKKKLSDKGFIYKARDAVNNPKNIAELSKGVKCSTPGCKNKPPLEFAKTKSANNGILTVVSGTRKMKAQEVDDIFSQVSDSDAKLLGFDDVDHLRSLIMTYVIVIPPIARPYIMREYIPMHDELTQKLKDIVTARNKLEQATKSGIIVMSREEQTKRLEILKRMQTSSYNKSLSDIRDLEDELDDPTLGREDKRKIKSEIEEIKEKQRITDQRYNADINNLESIITKSKSTASKKEKEGGGDAIKLYKELYTSVKAYHKLIHDKLGHKKGYIRHYALAKRGDFAARAVVGPAVDISLGEVEIPSYLTSHLGRQETVTNNNIMSLQKMMFRGKISHVTTKDHQDREYIVSKESLNSERCILKVGDKVIRDLMNGDIVVLVRMPTLHKGNMLAFRARIVPNRLTIGVYFGCTTTYGMDFDGDEGSIWIPQSQAAIDEVMRTMYSCNNIMSVRTGKPIIGIEFNAMLSWYLVTLPETGELIERDKYGRKKKDIATLLEEYVLPDEVPDVKDVYKIAENQDPPDNLSRSLLRGIRVTKISDAMIREARSIYKEDKKDKLSNLILDVVDRVATDEIKLLVSEEPEDRLVTMMKSFGIEAHKIPPNIVLASKDTDTDLANLISKVDYIENYKSELEDLILSSHEKLAVDLSSFLDSISDKIIMKDVIFRTATYIDTPLGKKIKSIFNDRIPEEAYDIPLNGINDKLVGMVNTYNKFISIRTTEIAENMGDATQLSKMINALRPGSTRRRIQITPEELGRIELNHMSEGLKEYLLNYNLDINLVNELLGIADSLYNKGRLSISDIEYADSLLEREDLKFILPTIAISMLEIIPKLRNLIVKLEETDAIALRVARKYEDTKNNSILEFVDAIEDNNIDEQLFRLSIDLMNDPENDDIIDLLEAVASKYVSDYILKNGVNITAVEYSKMIVDFFPEMKEVSRYYDVKNIAFNFISLMNDIDDAKKMLIGKSEKETKEILEEMDFTTADYATNKYVLFRDEISVIYFSKNKKRIERKVTHGYYNPPMEKEEWMQCILAAPYIDHFGIISSLRKRCEKYGVRMYSTRSLFSAMLPEDFTYPEGGNTKPDEVLIRDGVLITGTLTSRQLGANSGGSIIHLLHSVYGKDVAADFITNCYAIGNYMMDHGRSFTVGLEDCEYESCNWFINELKQLYNRAETEASLISADMPLEERESLISTITNNVSAAAAKLVPHLMEGNNPNKLCMITVAGTKGKPASIAQILGVVGQSYKGNSRILPTAGGRCLSNQFCGDVSLESGGFVPQSFTEGMSVAGSIYNAMGMRDAVTDNTERTPESGDIARNLIVSLNGMVILNGGVRSSDGPIISFTYGGDGMNAEKLKLTKDIPLCISPQGIADSINSRSGWYKDLKGEWQYAPPFSL